MTTNGSYANSAIQMAQWIQANLSFYQQLASNITARDLANRQQRLYGMFTDQNLGYLAEYDAKHPNSNLFNTVCQAVIYDSYSTMGFQAQPVMLQDHYLNRSFSSRFIPPQNDMQISVSIIQIAPHYRTLAMQPFARQAIYTHPNQMGCDLLNNLFMQSRRMAQYQYGMSNNYSYMLPTMNALQQRMNAMLMLYNVAKAFRQSPYSQIYDPNYIDASRYSQQRMDALNKSGLNLQNFKDTMNRVLPKIGQGASQACEAVKNGFSAFSHQINDKVYTPFNQWLDNVYPKISEKYKIQEKSSEELNALPPVESKSLQADESKTGVSLDDVQKSSDQLEYDLSASNKRDEMERIEHLDRAQHKKFMNEIERIKLMDQNAHKKQMEELAGIKISPQESLSDENVDRQSSIGEYAARRMDQEARIKKVPFADVTDESPDISQQFKNNARAIAEGRSIDIPVNSSESHLPSSPSLPSKGLEAGLGF